MVGIEGQFNIRSNTTKMVVIFLAAFLFSSSQMAWPWAPGIFVDNSYVVVQSKLPFWAAMEDSVQMDRHPPGVMLILKLFSITGLSSAQNIQIIIFTACLLLATGMLLAGYDFRTGSFRIGLLAVLLLSASPLMVSLTHYGIKRIIAAAAAALCLGAHNLYNSGMLKTGTGVVIFSVFCIILASIHYTALPFLISLFLYQIYMSYYRDLKTLLKDLIPTFSGITASLLWFVASRLSTRFTPGAVEISEYVHTPSISNLISEISGIPLWFNSPLTLFVMIVVIIFPFRKRKYALIAGGTLLFFFIGVLLMRPYLHGAISIDARHFSLLAAPIYLAVTSSFSRWKKFGKSGFLLLLATLIIMSFSVRKHDSWRVWEKAEQFVEKTKVGNKLYLSEEFHPLALMIEEKDFWRTEVKYSHGLEAVEEANRKLNEKIDKDAQIYLLYNRYSKYSNDIKLLETIKSSIKFQDIEVLGNPFVQHRVISIYGNEGVSADISTEIEVCLPWIFQRFFSFLKPEVVVYSNGRINRYSIEKSPEIIDLKNDHITDENHEMSESLLNEPVQITIRFGRSWLVQTFNGFESAPLLAGPKTKSLVFSLWDMSLFGSLASGFSLIILILLLVELSESVRLRKGRAHL